MSLPSQPPRIRSVKWSSTPHPLFILYEWYREGEVLLRSPRGERWVPVIPADKVKSMADMFPRLYKMLTILYREEPVTDQHIATLLMYSYLGQEGSHLNRAHFLSPDSVFTWSLTQNEMLWNMLEQVYSKDRMVWEKLIPRVNPHKRPEYLRESGGEVFIVEDEEDEEVGDDDDDPDF